MCGGGQQRSRVTVRSEVTEPISYLRYEVEYGIAEEGRGSEGDEECVDVLVVDLKARAFDEGHQEQAQQGRQAYQQHHQEPIAVR